MSLNDLELQIKKYENIPNIEIEAKRQINIVQFDIVYYYLFSKYKSETMNYRVISEYTGNKNKMIRRIETEKYGYNEIKEKFFVNETKGEISISNWGGNQFKSSGFSFTVSKEERTGNRINFRNPIVRDIRRINFFDRNFTISLSEVTQRGNIRYELEIELANIIPITKLLRRELEYIKYKKRKGKIITLTYAQLNEITKMSTLKEELEEIKESKQKYFTTKHFNVTKLDNITMESRDGSFIKILPLLKDINALIIQNKPRDMFFDNLTFDNLVINPYFMTLKVDGRRERLMFSNDGVYLSYNNIFGRKSMISSKLSLFDVEVTDKEIYIFDVMIFEDVPVVDMPFTERLKLIDDNDELKKKNEEIEKEIEEETGIKRKIKIKKHYPIINFFQLTNSLLDEDIPNDGLIFTPANEGYHSDNIFKWKPLEKLTIDLLVINERFIKDNKFYKDKPKSIGLYAYSRASNPSIKMNYKKVSDQLIFDDDIKSGDILEFKIDYNENNTKYIPYRRRFDAERGVGTKMIPNSYSVFKSIMALYRDPITEETIRGKNLRLMRKYHNRFKRDLYRTLYENKTKSILDIGSGKGADVSSWKTFGFNVTSIEPNIDNYNDLISTLDKLKFNAKVYNKKIEETNIVEKDTITMFNSITFFFENKSTAQDLISRLKQADKIIIVGFDAKKFKTYYPNGIESDVVTVNYLEDNRVFVKLLSKTVSLGQIEYIVDFDYLVKSLPEYDLIEYSFLNKEKLLSNIEFKYSDSTRVLYFKRKSGFNFKFLPLSYSASQTLPQKYLGLNFVRIGTIFDTSSLIHSILNSGTSYMELSTHQKTEFVDSLRSELASNFDISIFDNLPNPDSISFSDAKRIISDQSIALPIFFAPLLANKFNTSIHIYSISCFNSLQRLELKSEFNTSKFNVVMILDRFPVFETLILK